ncbi:PREDICTED: pentatricopeptide repeat-containing protein At4g21065-like [Nelumbo nucifera]|uniref:Pentatricopeptide repeat-containing protein At4g21065-like n=1 Tax=Nelumbo nucifera TaxID=4432 RepID=A0A1U8ASX0_NELNU|nr:PREDICTED: pentatricopeptide repeat-containing protein At4g21065-like [Nelumbo nucifera]
MFLNVFFATRLLITAAFSLHPPNLPLPYLLFNQIPNPDVFSYNIMIKASMLTSNPLSSLSFYHNMLLQGLHPNEYTFCFLLTSCSRAPALQQGRQVHAHFIKHGFDVGTFASTSLVHMYGQCGDLSDVARSFDGMRHRSNVSWGAIIDAYITRGLLSDALRLFAEMRSLGVHASNATLVSVLSACAKVQDLALGRMIHGHAEVRGMELNVILGTTLVNMYSKCGAIEAAMDVFSTMPTKSVMSWSCMINGLAMNGRGQAAIELFREMQRLRLEPNSATLVGVLNACSHAGLIDDGFAYFSCLSDTYRIEPNVKHYGCMVDLYGRAGRLEEAVEVVGAMPMKADAGIWGALLGACRVHGNTKLGELVAAQIIKVQPHGLSGCTGLSDMYAMDGRWDDAVGVRRMMMDVDIGREAGWSAIM